MNAHVTPPIAINYADASTPFDAARKATRALWRRRVRNAVCLLVVGALLWGGLALRAKYYAYYRAYVAEDLYWAVTLDPRDELVDVENNTDFLGFNPDLYYELRLTRRSYRQLLFVVGHEACGRKADGVDWPWSVPADAITFRAGGKEYLFSPATRTVYVHDS